jgi:site-specific recombinase XerD
MSTFGDRPATDVTTADVSAFLRALEHEGLTPRNVNKHREVLASMFTYGCRSDTLVLPVNPVNGTDKRRQDPPAALDCYEVEEVEALARAWPAARRIRVAAEVQAGM